MPMRPRVISAIASFSIACAGTFGTSAPLRITSFTCSRAWFASAWRGSLAARMVSRAKVRGGKSARIEKRYCERVAESQRGVVLAVGARLCGQASSATAASRLTFGLSASVDSALPVIAIIFAPSRFTTGRSPPARALSPEFDSAMKTSPPRDHARGRRGWPRPDARSAPACPVLDSVGGDLARDVAGLADAADDDAALAGEDQRYRGEKALVQARDSARTASASMARTRRASSSAEPVASFGIMAPEYSPSPSFPEALPSRGRRRRHLQPILILLARRCWRSWPAASRVPP
jgi:hypothetical protein